VLYVNKIEERGERAANKQDCEEGEEYGVGLRIVSFVREGKLLNYQFEE